MISAVPVINPIHELEDFMESFNDGVEYLFLGYYKKYFESSY